MPDKTRIALKYNICEIAGPCGVCGQRHKAAVGWRVFAVDGWESVCDPCVGEVAPELLVAAMAAEEAIWLHTYVKT